MVENKISKKFDDWNTLKKKTNSTLERVNVSKGQIWWAKLGQNIGVEIYGKHELFSRPVLIIRPVEGRKNAIVVPLTSQEHSGSWYYQFYFKGKKETVILPQIRSIDTSRLTDRIGEVGERTINEIIEALHNYLAK